MSGLAVVIGARGGIGSAVLAELVDRGRAVRAVGRHLTADQVPPGVEPLAADVSTPDGAAAAVRGASVVHHCAQPEYHRWSTDFPPLTTAVLDATAAAGATLVLADNLYCYGPVSQPLTEDLPMAATDPKGRVRVAMAEQLLAAHRAGRAQVVLGRVSDYFGPHGVDSALGATFFGRLLAGKRAQWIGALDQPHTMSYLPDVARALVLLGERDEAHGRAWHVPAEAGTGRELLRLTGDALGRDVAASTASPLMLRAGGLFSPMLRELGHVAYQWTGPWVADHAAFDRAFGPLPPTPMPDAVQRTVAWWRTRLHHRAGSGER
ncbi:MAG: NAD-dependent epimerase/dehydratase family protein [Dermatophilaceae bacterium]